MARFSVLPRMAVAWVVLSCGVLGASQNGQDKETLLKLRAAAATQKYTDSVQRWSSAYGVDPALVMAVITVESDGDAASVSRSGAMGLMQLMPGTCSDYRVTDPFDPDSNIHGGVALLADHAKRYKGDLQLVLAAYNAGPRHADDGSWTLISETRRYVPTVLAIYSAIKGSAPLLLPFKTEPPVTVLPPDPESYKTPPLRFGDMVFAGLRSAKNLEDPVGLAENGDLDDVAGVLLDEALEGRTGAPTVQARANKLVAKLKHGPKLVKAYCLTTAGAMDFTTEWDKQAPTSGKLMGSAHGSKGGANFWIVLLANPR